ncbi:MAG: carbohydrate kinase family protein [Desulfonatronovibrionaceae bacterium]
MDIIVSGSLALDRIMPFPGKFSDHILPDKIHMLNVCFMVNGMEEKFGGTAGNIAYNLRLLEEKPVIFATAGKDFGEYKDWLEKNDLSTQGIRTLQDVPTASAYITTDQNDNQIIGFNPGAMGYPCNQEVNGFARDNCLAIVSPGNLQDMQHYPEKFRKEKIPFICDPGQSIPALSGEELRRMMHGSLILVCNDYELEQVCQKTGLSHARILELTENIIVTLGEKGGRIINKTGEHPVPAVKVENAPDPTGAGDAFRAGVIKGLSQDLPLEEAARLGAVCASFCVEKHGTQAHTFTPEEVGKRLQEIS